MWRSTTSIAMFVGSVLGSVPDFVRRMLPVVSMADAGEHIRQQERTWEIVGKVGNG